MAQAVGENPSPNIDRRPFPRIVETHPGPIRPLPSVLSSCSRLWEKKLRRDINWIVGARRADLSIGDNRDLLIRGFELGVATCHPPSSTTSRPMVTVSVRQAFPELFYFHFNSYALPAARRRQKPRSAP